MDEKYHQPKQDEVYEFAFSLMKSMSKLNASEPREILKHPYSRAFLAKVLQQYPQLTNAEQLFLFKRLEKAVGELEMGMGIAAIANGIDIWGEKEEKSGTVQVLGGQTFILPEERAMDAEAVRRQSPMVAMRLQRLESIARLSKNYLNAALNDGGIDERMLYGFSQIMVEVSAYEALIDDEL